MNEVLRLAVAMIAGLMLGTLFFGGLWWTIRKGMSSDHPALWFTGSLLLRMSLTLAGFYCFAHGHWSRLLMCFLGFVIARLIVTRLVHNTQVPCRLVLETTHAPESR